MSTHTKKSFETSQWSQLLDEKLLVPSPLKIDRSQSYPNEKIPKNTESLLDNVHRHFRTTLKAVSCSSGSLDGYYKLKTFSKLQIKVT